MSKGNGKSKRNGKAEPDSGNNSGVPMVPQPNGSALLAGGMPGNAGGLGGIPSAIREYCRGAFAKRVPVLEAIADGQPLKFVRVKGDERIEMEVSANVKERVQAIDVLAKYGGVDKLALTTEEQPEQAMTPERIADMWERLQRIRTIRELEKLLVAAK